MDAARGRQSPPSPTVFIDLGLVVILLAMLVAGAVRSSNKPDDTGVVQAGNDFTAGSRQAADGTGFDYSGTGGGTSASVPGGSVAGVGTAASGGSRATTVRSGSSGGGPGATGQPSADATPVTGEAKDAPDCDQERGRIRVPSFYAPNCMPYWKGADNGGATYRGVHPDKVVVVDHNNQDSNAQVNAIIASTGYQDDTSEEEDRANFKVVLDAYLSHFETYGRTVEIVELNASGPPENCEAGRADAIKVATEIKAFASFGTPANTFGGVNCYTEELVARGVMCLGCGVTWSQELYDKYAPYAWSSQMNYDQAAALLAEYAGKRLNGRVAKWAGDPLLAAEQRKFGLITYDSSDGIYANAQKIFHREWNRFGAKISETAGYVFDAAQAQEHSRIMIAKMKDRRITTVIMAVDPIYPIFITQEATRQSYFPEWLIFGAAIVDTALFGRTYDQTQWAHAFGQGFVTARVTREVNNAEPNIVEWHCGCTLSSYPNSGNLFSLLSAMHLAGPKLTPETYRDGLFKLRQIKGHITRYGWSYGTGVWPWTDYAAIDDVTEIWWDANARGPDELGADGFGMYRYVDGGKRYVPGSWPTTEPKAFNPEGTVLMYTERPEADKVPLYEHNEAHHRNSHKKG